MLDRTRSWAHFALLVMLILLVLSVGKALAQDEQEPTRVRIGYFAFDPKGYDTYVDGEVFPFATSIVQMGWSVSCFSIRCSTASPFFEFSSGNHSFAVAPKDKGLEARILGPIEFTLEAGHAYSLPIVGAIEANNLDLLIIDEAQLLAGADPKTTFVGTLVNNIAGISAIEMKLAGNTEVIRYGRFFSKPSKPGSNVHFTVSTMSGDQNRSLFVMDSVPLPARVTDMGAMYGSYPGTYDKDYFYTANWGTTGKNTILDGGAIAVGDEVAGEIAAITRRVRYTLTLPKDMVVHITVTGAGPKNKDTILLGVTTFEPAVYVFDAGGKLLVWNDIISSVAKLEGLSLKAGTYRIEVGGSFDLVSGPFKLVVESDTSK